MRGNPIRIRPADFRSCRKTTSGIASANQLKDCPSAEVEDQHTVAEVAKRLKLLKLGAPLSAKNLPILRIALFGEGAPRASAS